MERIAEHPALRLVGTAGVAAGAALTKGLFDSIQADAIGNDIAAALNLDELEQSEFIQEAG